MSARKLTRMGLLTAIALTIFLLEAQLPPPVPFPGMKLGLANVVTLYAVFALGPAEAAGILAARVLLGSVFAGQPVTLLYAGLGGALALLADTLLRPVLKENQVWVAGAFAAMAHNTGQIVAAVLVTGTPSIAVYLPALLVSGLITGLFTGFTAQFFLKHMKKLKNK